MTLAARRDEPVVCDHCGRSVRRMSRQQKFCSARCQNKARWRVISSKMAQGSQTTWDHQNFDNENNALQVDFSRPRTPKMPLRMEWGGFAVVPDQQWPGMYRVRMPGGRVTDMVNLTRARDAAQALAGL